METQPRKPGDLLAKVPSPPNSARDLHNALMGEIQAFEAGMNPDEEIGAYLVSSAASENPFHVESVKRRGELLIFEGITDQRRAVRLAQHYTQVSILLTSLPKLHDKPRRIGFLPSEEESGQ